MSDDRDAIYDANQALRELLNLGVFSDNGGGGVTFAKQTDATPIGDPGIYALTSNVPADGGWIDVQMDDKDSTLVAGIGPVGEANAMIQTLTDQNNKPFARVVADSFVGDGTHHGTGQIFVYAYDDHAGANFQLVTAAEPAGGMVTATVNDLGDAQVLVAPGSAQTVPDQVNRAIGVQTSTGSDLLYMSQGGHLVFYSQPSAVTVTPPEDTTLLFTRQNNSDKTEIVARFASGAEVIIATEP